MIDWHLRHEIDLDLIRARLRSIVIELDLLFIHAQQQSSTITGNQARIIFDSFRARYGNETCSISNGARLTSSTHHSPIEHGSSSTISYRGRLPPRARFPWTELGSSETKTDPPMVLDMDVEHHEHVSSSVAQIVNLIQQLI